MPPFYRSPDVVSDAPSEVAEHRSQTVGGCIRVLLEMSDSLHFGQLYFVHYPQIGIERPEVLVDDVQRALEVVARGFQLCHYLLNVLPGFGFSENLVGHDGSLSCGSLGSDGET